MRTYEEFCEAVRLRAPFSFARFGDGEWECIFGKEGGNCDGSRYWETLGKALAKTLKEPAGLILGMQPKAMRDMGGSITDWLTKEGLTALDWRNADIFHEASIAGKLDPLFAAIAEGGRKIIMVGPDWLRLIENRLKFKDVIAIPIRDAWLRHDRILEQIKEAGNKHGHDMLILCAGMMSKVLARECHGTWHTIMDAGSLFDPLCGVCTRTYHLKIIERLSGEKYEKKNNPSV